MADRRRPEVVARAGEIVRAYPANRLGVDAKLGVYLSRWWEFLSDAPREANSEGGVFPAIFGTVLMTLVMSVIVVPFGVLAALYLREYAKPGPLVTLVRISVNNLAGVPSIVFGVFGFGFFCGVSACRIDQLLFAEAPAEPDLRHGRAALGLADARAAHPAGRDRRDRGSDRRRAELDARGLLRCGATKWQTIRASCCRARCPGS